MPYALWLLPDRGQLFASETRQCGFMALSSVPKSKPKSVRMCGEFFFSELMANLFSQVNKCMLDNHQTFLELAHG